MLVVHYEEPIIIVVLLISTSFCDFFRQVMLKKMGEKISGFTIKHER